MEAFFLLMFSLLTTNLSSALLIISFHIGGKPLSKESCSKHLFLSNYLCFWLEMPYFLSQKWFPHYKRLWNSFCAFYCPGMRIRVPLTTEVLFYRFYNLEKAPEVLACYSWQSASSLTFLFWCPKLNSVASSIVLTVTTLCRQVSNENFSRGNF